MKQVIRTDRAPAVIGPYSQGHRVGDFIFVAGQAPLDPQTGKLRGDTIEEQARQVLENIKAILQANGADLGDVFKITVILSDIANLKPMNEVYKTFFPEPFPARTSYGGQLPVPGMLVEIDAIAYVGE